MAIPGIHEAAQEISRLARDRHQDVDETRRLLYMALCVGRTKKYNLAGTLINALRHHQGVDEPGLERKVIDFLEVNDEGAGESWIREQIQRCTDSLS